jgi:hypothetical protein
MVQILRQLTDPNAVMPWEYGGISDDDRDRVGCFLQPIRRLLERNPLHRATVEEFRRDVRRLTA